MTRKVPTGRISLGPGVQSANSVQLSGLPIDFRIGACMTGSTA
jgi:hypothetical protein